MEHQRKLFPHFIDFKKAFNRVWRDDLWRVLKDYNIDNWLNEVTRLYDEATNALLLNGSGEDLFQMTVGV